jgi:HNH endonuclease
MICKICLNEFPDSPYPSKIGKQRVCSVACRNLYNARVSAKKRGDALRGRGKGKGYRKLNGRHEHRVVAEIRLGRPLLKGEIVHHENRIKTDNTEGNLEVMTQAEHASLHSRLRFGCIVEGCTRVHSARGFCAFHYDRFKDGRPITDTGEKYIPFPSTKRNGKAK